MPAEEEPAIVNPPENRQEPEHDDEDVAREAPAENTLPRYLEEVNNT